MKRTGWYLLALVVLLPGIGYGILAATTFARGGGEDPSLAKDLLGLAMNSAIAVLLIGFAVYLVRSTKG